MTPSLATQGNGYLFSLVILYKHYEADTEADKGALHVSSCYGSIVLRLLSLWCFIAMVGKLTVLIT